MPYHANSGSFKPGAHKDAYQACERQQDGSQHWWIAPRLAARRTGHQADTLHLWSLPKGKGCPALGGRRLVRKEFVDGAGRRRNQFYSEEQIDEVIKAEADLVEPPSVAGYMPVEKAAAKFRVAVATIYRLHKKGLLDIVKERGRAKTGKPWIWSLVSINDLNVYRKKRQEKADRGGRITVAEAAASMGVTAGSMRKLIRRRRIKLTKGIVVINEHLRKVDLLDREDLDAHLSYQQEFPQRGKPFTVGGIQFLPKSLALKRTGLSYPGLQKARLESHQYLDGRAHHKAPVPDPPRPVLAIEVPVKDRGRPAVWLYNQVDLDLIKACRSKDISRAEAHREAERNLQMCKRALAGIPLAFNIPAIGHSGVKDVQLPGGKAGPTESLGKERTFPNRGGRPKGATDPAVKNRDKAMVAAWAADRLLPRSQRRFVFVAQLAREFSVDPS
jgi:hypothetical protein